MSADELGRMQRLQQTYDQEMARANDKSREGLAHYVQAALAQYRLYRMSTGLSAEIHMNEALRLIDYIKERMKALGIQRTTAPDIGQVHENTGNTIVTNNTTRNSSSESKDQLQTADEIEKRPLEEVLADLDSLVGLTNVKKDVRQLVAWMKVEARRREEGLPVTNLSLHMVFNGNPGTGKTTVARLIAEIYHSMGLLRRGHLVEVDRSGMVGAYQGHTEKKVEELVNKSLGGLLFIDEAYSLAAGQNAGDFGRIAIDTLLKAMEDHRDDLVVVAAGYPQPMEAFLKANPGLTSRFTRYFYFEDYNPEELFEIFELQCKKGKYQLSETDGSKEYLHTYFAKLYDERDENFGNGRAVRNYFEKVLMKQVMRLDSMDEKLVDNNALRLLTLDDLRLAAES